MAIISGSYRHRTGTEAQRAAAAVHARELHFTSDRLEVWMGANMLGEKGYDLLAPDPAAGGYTVSSTLDWPVRARHHFARIAPVQWTGIYTHTIILPNVGGLPPRDGDEGTIFVVLPATAVNHVTLDFRNATAGGTQVAILTSGAIARKWKLSFHVTAGAWEQTGAAELLTE